MVEVNLHCESDKAPNNYIIENVLDGKCDIILYDNIQKGTKENEEGEFVNIYTYDLYRIIKNNYRDTLENDLSTAVGFNLWLEYAKEQYENQAENISIEERLATAEAVIAEILGGEV